MISSRGEGIGRDWQCECLCRQATAVRPLLSSAIFYAREANVDPLVVDEADHKRTAALEAARQFDATPPPTVEGDAVGNQAAGAAAMHSGEGSRQWAA